MYTHYYFLGIGGIGMSAIARYFNAKGYSVAGYDRTCSQLCKELMNEGIAIHFSDDVDLIPSDYKDAGQTLVVYTPAIAKDNKEFNYFHDNGFTIQKRAQVLGEVTRIERALCIAGTHGKTTTSTMTAHLLKESHVDCNAFLGGISKDYTSNLLLSDSSDLVVIEADEYDRSFHALHPYMAVVTATDADHLDIYGTYEAYLESFAHFTELIQPGGCLLERKGIALKARLQPGVKHYYYSVNEVTDFYATNVKIGDGKLCFDFVTPTERINEVYLGVPVMINVENAVAAMALAYLNGVTAEELRQGMASFSGIRRRFDIRYQSDKLVIIDDYAHHPAELMASIKSVKALYGDKKVLGVFQPHLYSRTADFYKDFASALSHLDKVVLVEIYPAREQPMAGVTSKLIFDEISHSHKLLTTKSELIEVLKHEDFDVLLTVGAGDIDTYIPSMIEALKK